MRAFGAPIAPGLPHALLFHGRRLIGPAQASPSEVWPPNRKMWDVTINYSPVVAPLSITCSLSICANDGAGPDDFEVVDSHHVRLRAERSGTEQARIYTVTVLYAEASGNSSERRVTTTGDAENVASPPTPRTLTPTLSRRAGEGGGSVEMNGIEPSASSMPFRGEVRESSS